MKRTALRPILGYEPEEWVPMGPQKGPPLPKWMGIYWPWLAPPEEAPPVPPAPPTPPPPPVELATLYGLVTDSETGYTLPGVVVSLNGYRTTTGSNGFYQFASIDPGSYEASFSKSGYQEDRMVATLIAGQATELSTALIPVAVPLPPPPPPPPPPPVELATLYGQVIDKQTGKPLAGAVVTLDGYQTTTDSSGYYEFTDVEPGSYTITISKAGYEEETKAVTLTAGAAKGVSAEIVPVAVPPPPPPPAPPPVAPVLPSPTCPVCGMVFDTWLKWYTHVLVNHPEWLRYKFICPHCGADYSKLGSRALWTKHILIEHPDTPFMPYVTKRMVGPRNRFTVTDYGANERGCHNYFVQYEIMDYAGRWHSAGTASIFNAVLCQENEEIALFLLYWSTCPCDESHCLLLE